MLFYACSGTKTNLNLERFLLLWQTLVIHTIVHHEKTGSCRSHMENMCLMWSIVNQLTIWALLFYSLLLLLTLWHESFPGVLCSNNERSKFDDKNKMDVQSVNRTVFLFKIFFLKLGANIGLIFVISWYQRDTSLAIELYVSDVFL